MNVIKTYFEKGPILLSPNVFSDERGYFYESFNTKEFNEIVPDVKFVQDNQSLSSYGVTRGLHFQKPPYAQSKLIRVIKGSIVDFALDIRKNSPTYGRWVGAYLTGENNRQLFIPKGFAHGFISLSDNTIVNYKCDEYYNKENEISINLLDPFIGITFGEWMDWRCIKQSEKDRNTISFNEFETPFEYGEY